MYNYHSHIDDELNKFITNNPNLSLLPHFKLIDAALCNEAKKELFEIRERSKSDIVIAEITNFWRNYDCAWQVLFENDPSLNTFTHTFYDAYKTYAKNGTFKCGFDSLQRIQTDQDEENLKLYIGRLNGRLFIVREYLDEEGKTVIKMRKGIDEDDVYCAMGVENFEELLCKLKEEQEEGIKDFFSKIAHL